MKATALTLSLAALLAPLSAGAQGLAQNQPQRQAILDAEYQLNQPGLPPAQAAAAQQRVAALEAQANGSAIPALPVPVYGSCAGNQSAIAYLADELAHGDIDAQQRQTDQLTLHDLSANLPQRGC